MRPGVLAILLLGLLAGPTRGGESVTLSGPGGGKVVLRPASGETLLLHFWATWCPSCQEDIDALQRAAAGCSAAAIRVITVNVGEGEAEVARFVAEHHVSLPVLRDPKGRVWREVDGRGLPTNMVWSTEARRTDVGPRTADAWQRELASLGCAAAGPIR